MTLYSIFETETSFTYLQEIVKILKEPICILGGWAVYFTVNNAFKEDQGRNYLGSRDIDLGFSFLPEKVKIFVKKIFLTNKNKDG